MKTLLRWIDDIGDAAALLAGVVFALALAYCCVYSVLRVLFFVWGVAEKAE